MKSGDSKLISSESSMLSLESCPNKDKAFGRFIKSAKKDLGSKRK